MIVLLDSGPAGLAINPNANQESRECNEWMEQLIHDGHTIAIPEIVDYELRRELLRGDMTLSLGNLDILSGQLAFLHITSPVIRRAAELWAQARKAGIPTADDKALDCDMILVAHAILVEAVWKDTTVIATTNVRHLARFADARRWREIA